MYEQASCYKHYLTEVDNSSSSVRDINNRIPTRRILSLVLLAYDSQQSPGEYPRAAKDYSTLYWEDYIRQAGIRDEINQRLRYLDDVFDEEENMERYRYTKVLLERFFDAVLLKETPLIGIDNNGQIVAEWHDVNDYKIISIKPEMEQTITIFCLKVSGTVLTVIKKMDDIIAMRDKDLQTILSEILV
jgi:hypothetical protein